MLSVAGSRPNVVALQDDMPKISLLTSRKADRGLRSDRPLPRYHAHTRWTHLMPLHGFGRPTPHASPR